MRPSFANLPTGRRLAVLSAIGVTTTAVVAVLGLQGVGAMSANSDARANLNRAKAGLHHLDGRHSELKVDAYRALLGDDVAGDVIDDVQSVSDVWDQEIDPQELGDAEEAALADLRDGSMAFSAWVATYVEQVVQDPAAARVTAGEIADRNHALDDRVDLANGLVDGALAAVREEAADLEAGARRNQLAALVVGTIVALVVSRRVTRGIVRPLRRSVDVLDQVAEGDLRVRTGATSHDEVGRMGQALDRSLDKVEDAMRGIIESATTLASSSEELAAVSQQMGATAVLASDRAMSASATAGQVSANVTAMAAGAEEMGASIAAVAANARTAADVASRASHVSEATMATVVRLGTSSSEIDHVVKVITTIAEQTNLLALNASIEAARAGESGKGFAVVANEVKALAKETAEATGQIEERISGLQAEAQVAVEAIREISAVVLEIDALQATIASAVAEQSVTTSGIGRGVHEAATGSEGIAFDVGAVADAAAETSSAASSIGEAAGELALVAEELRRLVGQFQLAPV